MVMKLLGAEASELKVARRANAWVEQAHRTVGEAAREDVQPEWPAPGAEADEAEAEMVAGGSTRSAASDLDMIPSSRDLSEAPELGIGCCNAEA